MHVSKKLQTLYSFGSLLPNSLPSLVRTAIASFECPFLGGDKVGRDRHATDAFAFFGVDAQDTLKAVDFFRSWLNEHAQNVGKDHNARRSIFLRYGNLKIIYVFRVSLDNRIYYFIFFSRNISRTNKKYLS